MEKFAYYAFMNKLTLREKRAQFVSAKLDELYPGNLEPPLKHKDPFTLLIAVLLSAQCRDERVNLVTPNLFSSADTPFKMMKFPVTSIQEIIRPCGLSAQKAKHISKLSEILVTKYAGEVPNDLEKLEELPGVGHKTAQVVLIQAFKKPAFPVDTHIHRLAKRWGLSSGKNVSTTEKDLKNLFPESRWSRLHLQIIFYARTHCSARGCDGNTCMICREIKKLK